MKKQEFKSYLVVDSHHGVYSWQLLAKLILFAEYDKLIIVNPDYKGMLAVIANTDPYTSEAYWWDVDSLTNAPWVYESAAVHYHVEEHEGDLWVVECGSTLF